MNVCRYCGMKVHNPTNMSIPCPRSPNKVHVLVAESKKYTCKYCGFSSSLVTTACDFCPKSPFKSHEFVG